MSSSPLLDAAVASIAFFVLLAIVVFLRTRIGEKCEIKTTDVAVAAIPVVLGLLLLGRIAQAKVAGIELSAAAKQPVNSRKFSAVTGISTQPLQMQGKAGTDQIESLRRKKVEALSFQLGGGFYVAGAVREYLDQLVAAGSLKHVVVLDKDNHFVCIADARTTRESIHQRPDALEALVNALNKGDEAALDNWLPNCLFRKDAVKADASKKDVLAKMDELRSDVLPVIDDQDRLSGIVDRAHVVASMIQDAVTAP